VQPATPSTADLFALLATMATDIQAQNSRYARLEQAWERDRADAHELRCRDLSDAKALREADRAQREEDIAAAQSMRECDLEEAAQLRSRDAAAALEHDAQLRRDMHNSFERTLLASQHALRSDMQASAALMAGMQSQMAQFADLLRGAQVSPSPNTQPPISSLKSPPHSQSQRTHSTLPTSPPDECDDQLAQSLDERDTPDIRRLPQLLDVEPSHLRPPVNFPSSLLLVYERQGFPIDLLRNHFSGTYTAPTAPTRASRTQQEPPSASFNINGWTVYTGPVLHSVEPLALVKFMVDWKAYQCTGTQHHVHHGISPQAAFSISPHHENYQTYSDEEIWALLWELFGPDDQASLKNLLHEVAALLFELVNSLPISVETCIGVRGFAAVVGTIVTYLNPGINISVDELSKHFLKCLPDSFSTPLRDYIHTYKTATVSGRYLYKSESWNLKMTLMVLEAFMTYSLKRVSELQGMLPSSATQRFSASSLLRQPVYSSAPFQLAAPTKLPGPHPVPAFGISASASQPSTAPPSAQAAHSKPAKPHPPGPHASIPLSPTAAATLSQQTNPGKVYAGKYTPDFVQRAHNWYRANYQRGSRRPEVRAIPVVSALDEVGRVLAGIHLARVSLLR